MQFDSPPSPLRAATDFPSLQTPPAHQDIMGQRTAARAHFVTEGEKKFNKLTYTTIGYVANVLMSVGAVFWVERTHSGQRTMNHFVEWAKKTLPSVDPETSKMLATKSFFLSGGFAALAPMKFLEDKKIQLVHKWNKEIYGEAAEKDPVLVQSQKEVASAPTQGWASIFSSRMLALVPFYATVGLLWDRGSVLSRATNSELSALGKEGAKALEHSDPQAFSHIAGKGLYFDRPIAYASRMIGKAWAKLAGNTEAVTKLEEMEAKYPGTLRSAKTPTGDHDPHHSALPYYFISEAITSGMVAWGVFALSRILAPLIGKKHEGPAEDMSVITQAAPAESTVLTHPSTHTEHPVVSKSAGAEIPATVIAAHSISHEQTAAPEAVATAR